MLNIKTLGFLAERLSVSEDRLRQVADSVASFCEQLQLFDPAKPDKRRLVLSVRGDLRTLQERLLRRIFLGRLQPSPHAHGGIRGRNIKTNALVHRDSTFLFTCDICDFFPSISHYAVYRLFANRLGCTPDVARVLTRLCTIDKHLALGLVTSPFLAEQILAQVDAKISGACESASLSYTRYVDDITISGPFDLETSGCSATVEGILRDHGFRMHKERYGRLSDGGTITNVTLRNGHPDVNRSFLIQLHAQFEAAGCLERGEPYSGPYFTRSQLAGRVHFVAWLNPGRKRELMRRLNSVKWGKVEREAARRGLVVAKKRLMRPGDAAVAIAS